MSPYEIAEREGIGAAVEADTFLNGNGAQAVHLRAVDHGSAERFVIGHGGAHAVGGEQFANFVRGVEEPSYGRTRITGPKMRATCGFQSPFDQQLITRKYFDTRRFSKPWVNFHCRY